MGKLKMYIMEYHLALTNCWYAQEFHIISEFCLLFQYVCKTVLLLLKNDQFHESTICIIIIYTVINVVLAFITIAITLTPRLQQILNMSAYKLIRIYFLQGNSSMELPPSEYHLITDSKSLLHTLTRPALVIILP